MENYFSERLKRYTLPFSPITFFLILLVLTVLQFSYGLFHLFQFKLDAGNAPLEYPVARR